MPLPRHCKLIFLSFVPSVFTIHFLVYSTSYFIFLFMSSSALNSPLHPSDSPLLSSLKPFFNGSVRSDPFHQPEKANYLPFYDFHYFTTHTVFYFQAVGSQHCHTPANNTHTEPHIPIYAHFT